MTGNKAELRIGGRTAHQVLLGAMPALTRNVLARLLDRVPVYGLLPREELHGDIARVVERNLRAFGRVLDARQLPNHSELGALRESAARRAEEGVPLDAVLTAYHLGVQVCLDELTAGVDDGDVADLMAVTRLALGYLERATATVAAAYFAERRTLFGDEHAARQGLLSALLAGGPSAEAAERAGIAVPASYLVLSLAVADHPDESAPAEGADIAARRKLRRLRVELEHQSRSPVLSLLSVAGGIALVPCDLPPDGLGPADWRRFAEIVDRIGRAAGAPVTAGAVLTEPDGVPGAATLAGEILAVARAFARPPGLYRLTDLLLEYQLTRPSAARAGLAALLEPLDAHAELLVTLRAYVDCGLSRQQAARVLHVHPNTVDYRLRRVAALTGLDPTRPTDLCRVSAALAARVVG